MEKGSSTMACTKSIPYKVMYYMCFLSNATLTEYL
jgi:hypothetical protein